MKIRILSVGTKMSSWVDEGYADYAKRLNPILKIDLIELPLAKRGKNTDVSQAVASEADAIKKHLRAREKVIVLDVLGKPISTQLLSEKLSDWQMEGSDIALIIGGPDGLDASINERSDEQWSLSHMTLPHPIVRLLVIEQLYRGLMINRNHPYHRE